ncbi:MAG: hypothetical protein ACR2PW_07065 [Gammaproteobacteria bacterium]
MVLLAQSLLRNAQASNVRLHKPANASSGMNSGVKQHEMNSFLRISNRIPVHQAAAHLHETLQSANSQYQLQK